MRTFREKNIAGRGTASAKVLRQEGAWYNPGTRRLIWLKHNEGGEIGRHEVRGFGGYRNIRWGPGGYYKHLHKMR